MDPEEYKRVYSSERTHWWYMGMQSITLALLKRLYPDESGLCILDAGCGTGGAMTSYLGELGTVTGVDISSIALQFSRERQAENLGCASVEHLPFSSSTFDLVTSFDVLYERSVANDLLALSECARVLKPGGRIFLRLPAYDWLRGGHDQVIHTARRYTKSRVISMLLSCSLNVELASYANMFLFPLALAKRTSDMIFRWSETRSDLSIPSGPLNGLLRGILSAEAGVISMFDLPFGLSVIAVGRKA